MNENTDKPLRALLDVMGGQRNDAGNLIDRIPAKKFGQGKARILRKMVMLAIAANADPDGTNSYPSETTIARRCLVSERAVRKITTWAKKAKILKIYYKGSPQGTSNRYDIIFPESRKRKKTKTLAGDKDPEQSLPGAGPGTTEHPTRNNSQSDPEQFASDQEIEVPPTVPVPSTDRPSLPSGGAPEKTFSEPNGQGVSEEILMDLNADLNEIGGQPFTGKYLQGLAGLLGKHPAGEIKRAYQAFLMGRKEKQMPYSPKDFVEGGAETEIRTLHRRNRKTAETAALVERTKTELRAQADAEMAERGRLAAAEAELADDPFFAQVSG